MSRDDVLIGERVRAVRLTKRIKQGDLAKKIGTSFQQLQKYERGQNRISSGRLMQIADALGVNVGELMGRQSVAAFAGTSSAHIVNPGLILSQSRTGIRLAAAFNQIKDKDTQRMLRDIAELLARRE
jgi:transcriptional regulator with XRE-family HTH domain